MTTQTIDTPRVYCGTYAKYNNGSIKGAWLDLSDYADASEFWQACKELHKDEADPEYMFQDYEYMPESEYAECGMDFDKLIEYAQLDEDQRELINAYINATGYSFKDIDFEEVEDNCIFKEDTSNLSTLEIQFVEEYVNSTGEIPEHLKSYIDWQKYGEDLLQDYMEADGYVFTE